MADNHCFSVLLAFDSIGMCIVRVIWRVLLIGKMHRTIKFVSSLQTGAITLKIGERSVLFIEYLGKQIRNF